MNKSFGKRILVGALAVAMVVSLTPLFQPKEVNAAGETFNLQLNDVTYSGSGGSFTSDKGTATVSVEEWSTLTVTGNNEIRDIPVDKTVTIVLTATNSSDEVKLEKAGQQFLNKGTGTVTNTFNGSAQGMTGAPGSNQMTLNCVFGSTPGPGPDSQPVTDHIELRVDCGPGVTESDVTVSYQKTSEGSWTNIKNIGTDGTVNGSTYSFATSINTLNIKASWGEQDYMIQLMGFGQKISADKNEAVQVTGFGSYGIQIDKTFYTVAWTYDDPSLGEDALVTHGRVNIKPAAGIAGSSDDIGGYYIITPGTNVTVEFIPDRGYQFAKGALNGFTVAAGQEVSTFTFTMPRAQLHLQALFKKTDDVVNVSGATTSITGGSISGDKAISSGNLELDVKEELPDADIVDDMTEEAGEAGRIRSYLDLNLTKFVNKGVAGDAWTEALTELENPVSITLKLDEELRDDNSNYSLVREHNGEYTTIPAVYNSAEGTITFETDRFSEYAVMTTPKSKAVKTGDDSNLMLPIVMALIAITGAGIIGFARRRTE